MPVSREISTDSRRLASVNNPPDAAAPASMQGLALDFPSKAVYLQKMFLLQICGEMKLDSIAPGESLRRMAQSCLMFLLALSLSSCASSRFEREWRSKQYQKATDLTGSWEGKWLSDSNGHTGKLRCIVRQVSGSQHDYSFQYQASWGIFLRGIFTIHCKALRSGLQEWKVSGSKDLGKLLGGEFSHQASITPQVVHADYHSQLDHGVMDLKRPGNGEISTKSATRGR